MASNRESICLAYDHDPEEDQSTQAPISRVHAKVASSCREPNPQCFAPLNIRKSTSPSTPVRPPRPSQTIDLSRFDNIPQDRNLSGMASPSFYHHNREEDRPLYQPRQTQPPLSPNFSSPITPQPPRAAFVAGPISPSPSTASTFVGSACLEDFKKPSDMVWDEKPDSWRRSRVGGHDGPLNIAPAGSSAWLKKHNSKDKALKIIIWIIAILVFGGAAGGVVWYFTHQDPSKPTMPTQHDFGLGGAPSSAVTTSASNIPSTSLATSLVPLPAVSSSTSTHHRIKLMRRKLHGWD